MEARRRLLMQQFSHGPEIGDIWESATKTPDKTLNVSGIEISENGMVVTDYIQIVPDTDYTMTITAGTTGARTRRFMCYDSNQTLISQLATWNWMNNGQFASNTVIMPSAAKYARICAYKADAVSVIGLMP